MDGSWEDERERERERKTKKTPFMPHKLRGKEKYDYEFKPLNSALLSVPRVFASTLCASRRPGPAR